MGGQTFQVGPMSRDFFFFNYIFSLSGGKNDSPKKLKFQKKKPNKQTNWHFIACQEI